MTIRQKLTISFFLILLITIFIIGVFFYSIYNLNEVHMAQKHRYDQIRRVERLKEYNHSFSWIVLDIITDYEKIDIVKKRLNKADELFESLLLKKEITIENSESLAEKENLKLLFLHFENLYKSIRDELYTIVLTKKNEEDFKNFSEKFDILSNKAEKLLIDEISYLQNELDKTEKDRNEFINTIKLEIVVLLFIAFLLSFIISTKIMNDIKVMLDKLNKGVLQLFRDDENSIKIDLGKNNELSEITNNLNSYLEKQDDIIHSREELLRNISHELKTPITKGKFLLENFKDKLEKDELTSVNSVFVDIEELTSKLLQREKLNFVTLNIEEFKVTSLILESLSKLSIDDESKIFLDVDNDFKIKGDKYYLTIVLKNLIDNAMKYAKRYPISIRTSHNKIEVENIGEKLANDLIYYTKPFTRDPNQQVGHGLGLNIVNKIIKMHNFKLDYIHKDSSNIFSIQF
ncbi:ATP-binding protein [Arcobacter arenosus]|uniref:histidine kinase n=1 Tax=Arcobacter arenosus TaxID=2576037 RepID=A0A5R8Y3T3_9BACT|nr:ATP-binding protein [Arcobacter arenosus]TLP40769.1 HAMP domain-containing histidine kinase [Arcobacter arenosus]